MGGVVGVSLPGGAERCAVGHFIEIVGGPGASRVAAHAWHQDRCGDASALTVTLGFPAADAYDGAGCFSHLAQLSHLIAARRPRGSLSLARSLALSLSLSLIVVSSSFTRGAGPRLALRYTFPSQSFLEDKRRADSGRRRRSWARRGPARFSRAATASCVGTARVSARATCVQIRKRQTRSTLAGEFEPIDFESDDRVPEAAILRPSYARGKEILAYSDARTIHSAPDIIHRCALWRFM